MTCNMCTTSPQKRRRTQESLIREGDKADTALCVRGWRLLQTLSIWVFEKRIGEAESTVRNILNKGMPTGRLTNWLPDQRKRGYLT